jgi:hypothetical protein
MKTRESSLKLLTKLINQEKMKNENRYPSKERRETELLKEADRTQTDKDDWFIHVPSCFNDCLDIAKTNRVIKHKSPSEDEDIQKEEKKIEKIWTQGSRFAFHRGCILYDTPKAYQKWSIAINEIKYCITIYSGKEAVPAINDQERVPGVVDFSILSPRPLTTELEEIGEFSLTQDDFVSFLINGNPNIIPK